MVLKRYVRSAAVFEVQVFPGVYTRNMLMFCLEVTTKRFMIHFIDSESTLTFERQ